MHLLKRGAMVCLLLSTGPFPGALANNIEQQEINEPNAFWNIWGASKTNYVNAPGIKGGAAQRVTIASKPDNPWDAGAYIVISKPVKKGDVIVLSFWARVEKAPAEGNLVMLTGRIEEKSLTGGGEGSPETNFLLGRQWQLYYAKVIAIKDYPADRLSARLLIGTGKQIIDFGPVHVYDMGPNYDVNRLPKN
jgi:hypothetical protein